VSSGCFDPTAFSDAVEVARRVFDQAESLGMSLDLLDVGGGFPGLDGADEILFEEIAACLRSSLDRLFPANVRVIAEPGRYLATACFTLAVNVIGRRRVAEERGMILPTCTI